MTTQSLESLPLTRLKGVGPALERKFSQLGISSIEDLLFHLPLRYEDRTRITAIRQARLGEFVQLEGQIGSTSVQFGRRRSLQCVMVDSTGIIHLRFFHFSAAQKNALAEGVRIRCYGEVRRGRSGPEIYHPEYRILKAGQEEPVPDTFTAVYPTTDGLQQGRMRGVISQALSLLDQAGGLKDCLPPEITRQFKLFGLTESIRLIHRPPLDAPLEWMNADTNPGAKRLAFEELLAHRLCMRRFKTLYAQRRAPALTEGGELVKQFEKTLPFELTASQRQVSAEIEADLMTSTPMLRLLQGDVGSGKTLVAALSALKCLSSGFQVALMAPTEILAEQHCVSFRAWFEPLGIRVGWLSGKTRAAERRQVLQELTSGECQLLIGTHALFQDQVQYKSLGLIIVDEQHRFGVHQRLSLRDKGGKDRLSPHQLVMTATPIPRTLAMSAYADLECSVISELPPGRTPVNTALISNSRRAQVTERILQACNSGQQAYWVCTLIEESEQLQAQAAEATAESLRSKLQNLKVGLIHGRMKTAEKQEIMTGFKQGDIHLLVATTVIEVGVDVPNASLMVIENPERLGLAQLHQLRGRVGRGSTQSHCIMLYQTPLSDNSKKRLTVMRESTDGFFIAEQDLELRGPGQVLGTQQTGLMTFRIADIGRDSLMLDDVKRASEELSARYPESVDPLIRRWIGERLEFVNV
ncbi:MAG: ATP-dependent DNA helicase RecG [Pseudohongiellaceae bacterium]